MLVHLAAARCSKVISDKFVSFASSHYSINLSNQKLSFYLTAKSYWQIFFPWLWIATTQTTWLGCILCAQKLPRDCAIKLLSENSSQPRSIWLPSQSGCSHMTNITAHCKFSCFTVLFPPRFSRGSHWQYLLYGPTACACTTMPFVIFTTNIDTFYRLIINEVTIFTNFLSKKR